MFEFGPTAQAAPQGGEHAVATAVRMHQEELLRAAYLLSGDEERAAELAEQTLLAMLRADIHLREDAERRAWLLRTLAAGYLSAPNAGRAGGSARPAVATDAMRFNVDDERARLWAALDRCDPAQRLALVLHDFDQLDEETVAGLARWTTPELRQRLRTARERLRDGAGARQDQPAQTLLMSLSMNAPRVDLWPRLAEPARRQVASERRRQYAWTGGVLAMLVLSLLIGVIWLGGGLGDDDGARGQLPTSSPSATSIETPPVLPPPSATLPAARPLATVADLYLLRAEQQPTLLTDGAGLRIELPGSPEQTALSPDGRWLVYVDSERRAGEDYAVLVAVDTTSAELVWQRELEGSGGRPVVTGEQVIVIEAGPGRSRSPSLAAYALTDGAPLRAWELDPHPATDGWERTDEVYLYLTPEGDELLVVTMQVDTIAAVAARTVRTYTLPVLEPSGTVDDTIEIVRGRWGPAFDFTAAHQTPDGSSLYSPSTDDASAAIQFFDLATAQVESVELPALGLGLESLWSRANANTVLSHDGRSLYLIARSGDVAVVDLLERRLALRFPLDLNGVAPATPGVAGWSWGDDGGVFSADGSRLYLLHAFVGQSTINDPTAYTVVWAVDVAQWRVLESRQVPGVVQSMALSADGMQLMFATRVAGAAQVHALDVASGQVIDVTAGYTLKEGVDTLELRGLGQLYQRQYGLTPAVGDSTPHDLAAFETLPQIDLQVDRKLLAAGGQAIFEVRLLHPADQTPVRAGQSGVRLDPAANVTLTLSHAEADDLFVIPVRLEDGVYRAGLPLPELGAWDATLAVSYTDGTRWERRWTELVQVNAAYSAGPERAYLLELTSNPGVPVAGTETQLVARFVDVESGEQLTPEAALDIGLPEVIDVLFRREDGAFKAVTLLPTGHGYYSAPADFRWTGFWRAELSFRTPDGVQPSLRVGTWEIVSSDG